MKSLNTDKFDIRAQKNNNAGHKGTEVTLQVQKAQVHNSTRT